MTTITTPPTAPSRADRSTHDARTDAWILWEETQLVPQLNAVVTEINDNAIIAANGAAAATVAIAAANFKGLWSALTGAQPTGISCFHLGAFWILSADVADVTTKVPGTASEWKEAKTINALPYFKCTGAVTAGNAVAINKDGSVSVPAITAASAGASTTATGFYGSVCYAPDVDKFVFVYSDGTNIKARVGTLTGTTFSFGAESSAIGASYTKSSICYDTVNSKVIVAYAPASGISAHVGTISGTTISFTGAVSVTATASSYTDRHMLAFDSDSGKCCLAYKDGAGNLYAKAGTISAGVLTFGAACDLGALGASSYMTVIALPSMGNKFLISYLETSYKSRVLTLSGTTLTAQTAFTLHTPFTSTIPFRCAFDPVSKKIVYAGCSSAANIGIAVVGTLAVNDISYSAVKVFASGGVGTPAEPIEVVWNTFSQSPTILFSNLANSNYATMASGSIVSGVWELKDTSVVYSGTNQYGIASPSTASAKIVYVYGDATSYSVVTPYSTSAVNFIGIAQDTVSSADFTRVATGQYVTENQTGLTVGAKYYCADNGTISETPSSVFVGTAVGASRLLVKG